MLRYKRVSDERFDAESVGFDNESCVPMKDKASINLYALYRYCFLLHKYRFLRSATH